MHKEFMDLLKPTETHDNLQKHVIIWLKKRVIYCTKKRNQE